MPDLEPYFAAIKDEQQKIDEASNYDGFVFVTSVRNLMKNSTAGCVSQVPSKTAAKHIVDGTARLSTSEERDAFIQSGILFAAKCASAEARRNPALGQTLIVMPRQQESK